MISTENFKDLLRYLQFAENGNLFTKHFENQDCKLIVDFHKHLLIYPEDKGLIINEKQTCNFSSSENFVVFECVHRLLEKGYLPQHLELEPKWKVGHGASGGRADILIKNQENKPLLLIECKTADKEFKKAWKETLQDGGQLFSYAQQISETQFLCLYASDFNEKESKIIVTQQIISHKDNKDVLEQDKNLKSFEKARDVKERYEVWKNTYKLESTDSGIFEESIQPYQIGKSKYTLAEDTQPLNSIDKKGLYHEFRTILRKHNVSRRENAFDVLVNLFLCKIIDETENKTDLKFRWKGIAYDNYYDLVDRLQGLYQVGMKKFLKEEILYVSNEEIDKAFWTTKTNRNATKKRIKDIFRELKFYKGLDFEFVKVHNSRGFDKNAKILIDIIKMWQSVRLTSQTQNQFLGDMFEFFLDNGIKQTQGQFFTPIPICKFIVASLPLEQKISEKSEPLNVIDYACGSGHFLTEYALAAQPIIEKYKETSVKQHFQHIYGIEKEDRLAKVATVSACMYGQNEINVIDTDALASHEVLRKENFDVLVANPPFAVDDFLDTLVKNDEKEAKTYELFAEDRIGTNNIQCLFLERAKQLLARNGVAGIIVPTSILSNSDTMHIQTREILLKYFDWISIVELGSGTFGKTGTNTVVLFLRRKEQNPEQAEHFWNRTLDFFENADEEIESNGGMYQDLPIVKKYCQHINIPFEIYQKILHTTPQGLEALVELEKYDIFKEYKNSFEKSTEVVNLQKKNDFKKLLPEKQTEKLNKMLWEFIRKTEQEKLFYFMLAHQNTQKVLIVKSPADSKEQKQFLGYEWTNAMGNEGIKYNNGETVYDINTPLFNPNDRNDQTKISYWIAQNFKSLPASPQGLEALAGIVSYANLTDLLDFSRKDFNKAISLTMKKKVEVESKWEMVKIEELCEIGRGRVINHQYIDENQGEYPVYSSQTQNEGVMGSINTFDFDGEYVTWTTDGIYAGTCFYRNGKFNCTNVCGTLKAKNEKLIIQFLPLVLNDITPNHVVKSANPKLMNNVMANIKIPLPPLEIQEKIVLECEAIDKAAESAKNEVEKAKKEIEEKAKSWFETSFEMLKIENVLILEYGKGLPEEKRILGEFAVMGSNGITGYHNEYLVTAPAIIVGRKGSAGKLVYTEKNCYPIDTTFYVKPILDCNMKYLYYTLLQLKLDEMGKGTGVPGLNRNDVYQIKIPVPPLSTQETLVSEIEKLELQIAENQGLINGAKAKKEEVLKRYL